MGRLSRRRMKVRHPHPPPHPKYLITCSGFVMCGMVNRLHPHLRMVQQGGEDVEAVMTHHILGHSQNVGRK